MARLPHTLVMHPMQLAFFERRKTKPAEWSWGSVRISLRTDPHLPVDRMLILDRHGAVITVVAVECLDEPS